MKVEQSSHDAARFNVSAEAVRARVAAARAQLADAAATADLPGVARALDELEDAHRLARRFGVPIPRAEATASQGEGGGEK